MADETQTVDFPEAWKPESGDAKTIRGTVSQVPRLGPDFGFGPYPIVTLKTADGERSVHARGFVLRAELARRNVGMGDELEITYEGKRPPTSGHGNPYHVYKVKGGKEPEFSWDQWLPEEERQAQTAPPIQPMPVPAVSERQIDEKANDDDDPPF